MTSTVENSRELGEWLALPEVREILGPVREIQAVLLEMLQVIDQFCLEHQLRYYVACGSMLGALRNGGLIPWDDDADVLMPREDYDKFVELAEREMPPEYFMQSYRTERWYRHPFAKLRKNGTTCIVANHKHLKMHQGVFIDIFPYEGVPENAFKAGIMRRGAQILDGLSAFSSAKLNGPLRAMRPIQAVWKLIFSPAFFNYLCNVLMRMMNDMNSQWLALNCYRLNDAEYERNKVKRAWLEPARRISIDGVSLLVPHEAEACLRQLYGDWQSLPPPECRHPIHSAGGVIDIHKDYREYL